ncbi:MAG: phosphate-starvation-inducible PsiE family protein [ANME-2 cluster archaeon]|nr:phosphate-starvation-inducible PsiE family protein [ANME-2 cluster archaeon]
MKLTIDHDVVFKKTTEWIIIVILYILLIALFLGAIRIILTIPSLLENEGLDVLFYQLVANSLTLFIVIEFFKTLQDFSKHERIKLTYVIDATILIVLREISVGLFTKELSYLMIGALSILLMVMGIIRVMAVRYSPKAENM